MKIYLAHPDAGPGTRAYRESEAVRAALTTAGHTVLPQTSEGDLELDFTYSPWDGENDGLRITADITACDLFIAFTYLALDTARVPMSTGYALGAEKPVIRLGPVLSTLECLPQITHYYSVEELLSALEKLT